MEQRSFTAAASLTAAFPLFSSGAQLFNQADRSRGGIFLVLCAHSLRSLRPSCLRHVQLCLVRSSPTHDVMLTGKIGHCSLRLRKVAMTCLCWRAGPALQTAAIYFGFARREVACCSAARRSGIALWSATLKSTASRTDGCLPNMMVFGRMTAKIQ